MSKIMKVGELIEILKQFPQDENVVILDGENVHRVGRMWVDKVYPYAPKPKEATAVNIALGNVVASYDDHNVFNGSCDDRPMAYGLSCYDDEW